MPQDYKRLERKGGVAMTTENFIYAAIFAVAAVVWGVCVLYADSRKYESNAWRFMRRALVLLGYLLYSLVVVHFHLDGIWFLILSFLICAEVGGDPGPRPEELEEK